MKLDRNRTQAISHLMAVAILLPLGTAACHDEDPAAPQLPTLRDQITRAVDEAIGSDLPGVQLKVLGPGTDLEYSAGTANLATSEAMGLGQPFFAASTGKMFVAAAAAMLVQDGVLSLDGTLADLLPESVGLIPGADGITLRHLLQQTSGIIDVLNEIPGIADLIAENPGTVWTNEDLASLAAGLPLHFEPGSAWRYSNTNYILASLILERVTGQDYAEVLRGRIFEPLGMASTLTSNHGALAAEPVHGYLIDDEGPIDATEVALLWEVGSGGQWTTVDDLTRYLHALATSDTVFDDGLRDLILSTSSVFQYGLGVFVVETPFGPMVGHGGLSMGYSTTTGYFVDHGVSIVLFGNAQGRTPITEDLFLAVRDLVFGA